MNSTQTHNDRLSELPDLAIVHILSHLYTNEAARTTVLSKRFNSLWTSVDSLRFSDEYSGDDAAFVRLVDTATGLHRRKHLDKLFINFTVAGRRHNRSLNRWLQFAAQKQVKTLHLKRGRVDVIPGVTGTQGGSSLGYKLPKFLFSYEQLEELVTSYCDFSTKAEISWSKLKLLSVTHAKLSEDIISKILKGCNVLETLEFRNWTGFDKLKIDSPSLRVLRIVEEQCLTYEILEGDECVLDISGPKLVSLEVSGVLYRTKLRVSDVGNLVNAVMDFEIRPDRQGLWFKTRNQDIVREVLESLCLVKVATFGGFFIQALSTYEEFHLPSPWSERKSLTLCMPVMNWDWLGVASLLHSSPCLETLVIRLSYCSPMCFSLWCLPEHRPTPISRINGREESYWRSCSTRSRCPLLYLKRVKILGFQVSCQRMTPLFQFLGFVLRNAKILEEIVVQTTRYVTRVALNEALKLLDLPTASPDAVVHFEPPHLWIDPLCMYKPDSL